MPEYLSPGVYMEEIDSSPKPIEGVSTSTAAFIGFTEKAVKKNNGTTETLLGKAELITNLNQYTEHFGGFAEGAYLPYAVHGFFHNGGQRCYVISVQEMPKAEKKLLDGQLVITAKHAGAGGQNLQIKVDVDEVGAEAEQEAETAKKSAEKANANAVKAEAKIEQAKDDKAKAQAEESAKTTREQAGKAEADAKAKAKAARPSFNVEVRRSGAGGEWEYLEKLTGVKLVEKKDKVKVAYKYDRPSQWIDVEIPEAKPNLATLPKNQWEQLTFEAKQLPAPDVATLNGDVSERSGIGGLEALDDVSIVCVPDLMTPAAGQNGPDLRTVKAVQDMMVTHCERMGDRVAILDPLPNLSPKEVRDWRLKDAPDSSYAALYYPWIEVIDPIQNRPLLIPPSGHMAGIWARTDGERGVHKAPANEPIRFMTNLSVEVTKGEQDTLNPEGINCIRVFPGRGVRVWGARTLSSNPSWRYLNVRRLFNYVEKSIERSTQWVVFEPNDQDLWARVTRDVKAFLRIVWREGALFGLSEDEAFHVKCDAVLNPSESRDLGRLIIEVAMAPVKPAEFVIFRIMQKNETE